MFLYAFRTSYACNVFRTAHTLVRTTWETTNYIWDDASFRCDTAKSPGAECHISHVSIVTEKEKLLAREVAGDGLGGLKVSTLESQLLPWNCTLVMLHFTIVSI